MTSARTLAVTPLRRRWAAMATVAGLLSPAVLAVPAVPAIGDTLTIESFTGANVTDASAWVAGGTGGSILGWPGGACLTAGSDTSQVPVPGCGLTTPDEVHRIQALGPDPIGSGVLRLTPETSSRAGFALHNKALPTGGGLDITFEQSQWGGSGADGISFFLVDGSVDLTSPGAPGQSLGYAQHDGSTPGVTGGLLGIGLDAWGQFSDANTGGEDCLDGDGPGSKGPGQTPNTVVVRGPGTGTSGYCWLGASSDLSALGLAIRGATRAAGAAQVRIVVDPDTVAERRVTVYLDGVQVVQVPVPDELAAASTFKFGFGAATGGATDNHEVWNLGIETVDPVDPTTTTVPADGGPTTSAPPPGNIAPVARTTPRFTG